jgi:hypothetical protein
MLTVLRSLALIKENVQKGNKTHQDKHPTYMKQMETQIETVELPKAKATLIKRKAGYSHDRESEHKKRADYMVIDAETHG